MIRAFNLECRGHDPFQKWSKIGRGFIEKTWPKKKASFSDFLASVAVDGDEVQRRWFSELDAHVFISHSHQDEDMAVGVAGLLTELGLRPFVDSLVWHDSARLLREIDEKYSWLDEQKKDLFDYKKRNYSTSHVHMMLASAIAEMIDRCECVIFLNTPRSIQASDTAEPGKSTTASPWIYHELITTKLLRQRWHKDRPKGTASLEQLTEVVASDSAGLRINYAAPVAHLGKLAVSDLDNLQLAGKKGLDALDWLYKTVRDPRTRREP